MRYAASDPTAFDWWAGIWVPTISGFLSIAMAGVALWIALRALDVSNRANALTTASMAAQRHAERKAVALRLNTVWQSAARAWIKAREREISDVMPDVLDAVNEFRVTQHAGALSLAEQLLSWHVNVGAGRAVDLPHDRRVDFMIDVGNEWSDAVEAYVADDTETWRMPKSQVKL